jgi:hypothetical protein
MACPISFCFFFRRFFFLGDGRGDVHAVIAGICIYGAHSLIVEDLFRSLFFALVRDSGILQLVILAKIP